VTNIRVVLDTTALLAYARLRGMAAAGLVAMVEEEGGAALVSAYEDLDPEERDRLVRLATTTEGVTVILPLTGIDTVEVATLGPLIGHAVVEARRWRALLATYQGTAARKYLTDRRILNLEDD
jgi:hypothetical protein